MIALDTNVVIVAMSNRIPRVRERLDAEIDAGMTVGIPAIVLAELHYGSAKSLSRARAEAAIRKFLTLDVSLWSFDEEDAVHAGDIRGSLEMSGTPIGHYDVLIAAQARRRGAILITANRREFDRVPGLAIDDWLA